MKKTPILAMIFILISLANAETFGTFQKDTPIQLVQTCGTCTSVNISSVTAPNSTVILNSKQMYRNGTLFNYTLAAQSLTGQYIVCGSGDLDAVNTAWCYTFTVTTSKKTGLSGIENSLIVGIGLLLALFIIFTLLSFKTYPFLANFFFLGTFIIATIGANMMYKIAFLDGSDYITIFLALYKVMLYITMTLIFITLIVLTVDSVKLRRFNNNPVDNYKDNLK